MPLTAQSTPAAEPAPILITMAVYSLASIVVVLAAHTFTYLLRRRLEGLNRTVQGISQNRYVAHIQGPAAAGGGVRR